MTALYHYHTIHLNDQGQQVHNSGTIDMNEAIICSDHYRIAVKAIADKHCDGDHKKLVVTALNLLHSDRNELPNI